MYITQTLVHSSMNHIQNEWVRGKDTNVFYKHILARGAHLGLVPVACITTAIDTVAGLGSAIGTVLTLGTEDDSARFTFEQLKGSGALLMLPMMNFMLAFNSSAMEKSADAWIGMSEHGLVSAPCIDAITDFAQEFEYSSDSCFTRNVTARLSYAVLLVSCIVTRAVDGVLGVLAAVFAIVPCFAYCEWLNHAALRGLQAPEILRDLFVCTIGMINPYCGQV